MELETFEKLVDEHLFILQNETLSKKGAREFRIFGKEALYKQLMLGGGVGRSEQLIAKEQDAFDKGYTKGWAEGFNSGKVNGD